MAFAANAWTIIVVDGALTDSEVTNFNATAMIAAGFSPPGDWNLCLSLEYGSAAAAAVRFFFAAAGAAAPEDQVTIVDDTLQSFIWPSVYVPREPSGVPWTLRVTKAAGNANVHVSYRWQRPG